MSVFSTFHLTLPKKALLTISVTYYSGYQWWASLTLKFRVNSKLNFQLLTQSPVKLNKYASLFAKMVIDSKKYRFFFSSLILNKHCKKRSNQSEQNNLGIDGTSF